ncbi:DNA-binding protein HEXBP-like [Diorhabda sublineata]|uniref:DNA-binding protein HEXBP-like n=1 Tax=Diorhabda sublineata TaxID=1163346 RepID=UPI0024E050F3|nr:DNA-binding protein HEXBP-like [Diorhabda sublineata]
MDTVRIGWAPCQVRARVKITRCFKCLEFGHRTKECKGTDNSKMCLKCGKDNHKARDCLNKSYCLTCKKDGHRADQTACPYYLKLVKEKSKAISDTRRRLSTARGQNFSVQY